MEPQDWLQKALEELLVLAPVAENDPDDAWRAIVLLARLLGSPSGPTPPAEVIRHLPALLSLAGQPGPDALLDRLSEELESAEDPAGPLLDVLLDIDDSLGVLSLSGDQAQTQKLFRSAAERVARAPERVEALGAFATLRIATVRPDSPTAVLWNAVARASAPSQASPVTPPPSPGSEFRGHQRSVRLVFPEQALRAAAWTSPVTLVLEAPSGKPRAWLYEEAGRLQLELQGSFSSPLRLRLAVVRKDDATEKASAELTADVSGNTAYADLGPAAGQGNLLYTLLAQAGLSAEEAALYLVVMDG